VTHHDDTFGIRAENALYREEKRTKKASTKYAEKANSDTASLEGILQTEAEKEAMMSSPSGTSLSKTKGQGDGKIPSSDEVPQVTPNRKKKDNTPNPQTSTIPHTQTSTNSSTDSFVSEEFATDDVLSTLIAPEEKTHIRSGNVFMTWIIGVQNNTIQSSQNGGRCIQDAVENTTPTMCSSEKEVDTE
jgi:hypothetical protein